MHKGERKEDSCEVKKIMYTSKYDGEREGDEIREELKGMKDGSEI